MNEPYGNIKPGDSRELIPGVPWYVRTFVLVWVLPMLVVFVTGWLGALLFTALREGWNMAHEWIESL
jgi:hypothetical protein